jgi:hypothetical protein
MAGLLLSSRGPSRPLVLLGRSQRRILDTRKRLLHGLIRTDLADAHGIVQQQPHQAATPSA